MGEVATALLSAVAYGAHTSAPPCLNKRDRPDNASDKTGQLGTFRDIALDKRGQTQQDASFD